MRLLGADSGARRAVAPGPALLPRRAPTPGMVGQPPRRRAGAARVSHARPRLHFRHLLLPRHRLCVRPRLPAPRQRGRRHARAAQDAAPQGADIAVSYVPALKGDDIRYNDPVLFLDAGIWHLLAPTMYDDVKEYLNWYDTRRDANDRLKNPEAPVIGLVLQRSLQPCCNLSYHSGMC